MVTPIPRPQAPSHSRISTRTGSIKETTNTRKPPLKVEEKVKAIPPKPNGKPSLYARYCALSFKVKIYIWITTAGAAWLADSLSDRIFEQNMIDAEAHRRVEKELRKMKQLEQSEQSEQDK